MEVSFMADTFSITRHHISITDVLQTSSAIFPIDAVAPPTVRSKPSCRAAARRVLLKSRRRTKRRSPPIEDGGDAGFFAADGGEGGFPGGGSGGGWNFDGFGGGGSGNWDDDQSSPSNSDDPAFDFVYEVVCWIVFSNCLHFAFKKVVRLVSVEREKSLFHAEFAEEVVYNVSLIPPPSLKVQPRVLHSDPAHRREGKAEFKSGGDRESLVKS
ncbi:hypothetical protein Cgig2_011584 [Carnegiea gigantea]|uniref:Uncharacterized protein n=1 Tax=Carnegiea gigantea TaxID=171969 RepID=A0A9Q1QDJ6_9CARY|nr:hypothetical protein Cgig2_011584 [Carnegiea gigantea]